MLIAYLSRMFGGLLFSAGVLFHLASWALNDWLRHHPMEIGLGTAVAEVGLIALWGWTRHRWPRALALYVLPLGALAMLGIAAVVYSPEEALHRKFLQVEPEVRSRVEALFFERANVPYRSDDETRWRNFRHYNRLKAMPPLLRVNMSADPADSTGVVTRMYYLDPRATDWFPEDFIVAWSGVYRLDYSWELRQSKLLVMKVADLREFPPPP